MAFKFKVAYTTNPNNIPSAITNGLVDEGDLIIINQEGQGSLRFILQDKTVLPFTSEVDDTQLNEAINNALSVNIDDKITSAVDNKVEEVFDTNLEDKVKPIVDAAVQEAVGDSQTGTWEEF